MVSSSLGTSTSGTKPQPAPQFPKLTSIAPSTPKTGKFTNQSSLVSIPNTVRTHKTECERAQGPQSKFSNLNKSGKKALKSSGKQPIEQPRVPSNKELSYIYRKSCHILDYSSKLPCPKGSVRQSSSGSHSPSSPSSSSCSYHSSLSSGPKYSRPQEYTSLSDVQALVQHSTVPDAQAVKPSRPNGIYPRTPAQKVLVHKGQKVSAPQGPNSSPVRAQQKVEAAGTKPHTASGKPSSSSDVSKGGVQDSKSGSSSPVKQVPRRHNNWGTFKRPDTGSFPEGDQKSLRSLKTVDDVRALQIFPSELSLRMQEHLCNLLDGLNVPASEFARNFVLSRIREDKLKAISYCFLISNKGAVHFFNADGHYVGRIVVNEPVWFYGRVAGSNKGMYLSLGDGKTSKCFLKSRFPTLREFLVNDWAKGKSSLKHVTVFDPVKNRNWRGDRGFCWLPLYLASEIPLAQYPTSGLVRLFSLYDKFGPVPIVKTGKYYHYDVNGRRHIKFPNVWVGAEDSESTSEITTWEDCNADPLLRTAVDSVLKRTVLKESSNFQTNIDNLFDKALSHALHSSRVEKISVSQHLTAEEFELLKGFFGLPFLGNGSQPRNPHSLLNAMRECFNRIYLKAFRGVTVSDIGGNLASAVFSDSGNLHVCMPLIDMKDAARQTKSAISLLNGLDYKYEDASALAKRLQTLKNLTFCNKPVPCCTHQSTVIIMVDVYDVSLYALLQAMEKKGSLLARCCFMFPPELLNSDGTVVHPDTNVVVTREGELLRYHVANTSDCYTQDVKNVMSYLRNSSVISKSGLVYSVELLNQNGPYLDFQISLSVNSNSKPSTRSFQAWLRNKSEVVVQNVASDGALISTRLIMDRDFVRRVLSYSANVCNTIDDRTFEYVLSNIRSQTTMMIVGSKIVHNKVELSNDVVVELPATFLREAVRRRRKAVEAAKRGRGGFLTNLLRSLIGLPGKILRCLINTLRKLLPAKLRKAFDNLVEEEVLIKDCSDTIITQTHNESGQCELRNAVLKDVLDAVRDLTLLSAPKCEIEEVKPAEPTSEIEEEPISRKQPRDSKPSSRPKAAGLLGGGGNWYDFLLPKAANKDTGSSFLANIWRLVRKLERYFSSSTILKPVFWLLEVLLKVLKAIFLPLLTAVPSALTAKKTDKVGYQENLSLVGKIFMEVLGKLVHLVNNTIFGDIFGVLGETATCVGDNFTEFRTKIHDSTLNCLKTKIASGMLHLGMKPPKGWYNETSIATMLLEKATAAFFPLILPTIAVTSLVTLIASKTIREKVMGLSHKVVCFFDSVRVKRPMILCSVLVGALINTASRLGFLLAPFEDFGEICVGLMFSDILGSAYSCYKDPSTLQKVDILARVLILQQYFEIWSTCFALEEKEKVEKEVRDVGAVQPVFPSLELNPDTAKVIEGFKANLSKLSAPAKLKASVEEQIDEPVSTSKPCAIKSQTSFGTSSGTSIAGAAKPISASAVTEKGKKVLSESPPKETGRLPEKEAIRLEEPRTGLFEENVEVSKSLGLVERVNEQLAVEPDFMDKVVEKFNLSLQSDSDKSAADSSLSSEVGPSGVITVEKTAAPEADPNAVTMVEHMESDSFSPLKCACGIEIPVDRFVSPGPLPLLRGDSMNNREAWFYSRGGEGYSYTGYSHKSRGWLSILDRFVSATGLKSSMFDHCLIQKYNRGAGIPFHKDNEPVYPIGNPILTIHLSGEGMFSIKCGTGCGELLMTKPCWFLMPCGFQKTHLHSVTCSSERVSLTFRATQQLKLPPILKSPESVEDVDSNSASVMSHIKACAIPQTSAETVILRPQTPSRLSEGSPSKRDSLLEVCVKLSGMNVVKIEDFLNVDSYKSLKHYVSISGNLGAVVEAFSYNLHELHREVSVLTRALQQPEILVGKRREVYSSSIPDLDRVKVCNSPEDLFTDTICSFYGSVTRRTLFFSNDKVLREEDSVLYLAPSNVSFPLKRCLGMFKMMEVLTLVDVERALVGCKFINAVPGAGKTFEIKGLMKSHAVNKNVNGIMLVLTASRNAADSLNEYWDSDINSKRVIVMTVDSFIFSGGRFYSEDIYSVLLDECYMSHAGLCILIAALTNPSFLSFYGDRRQVPFINRNPIFRDSMGMLKVSQGSYTEKLLTYRCPADICYWMSSVDYLKPGGRLYSGPVKTVKDGRPLKSVRITPFSPSQLDFMKHVDRVMTFTQLEKTDLISKFQTAGFGDRDAAEQLIGTVAESQGETYSRVALVRTKAADDAVFSSFPHRLVALTGHTQSLEFVCLPSKLSKGIGKDVQMIEKLESSVAKTFVVQQHV
ncbi:polyprotein [Grapevine leafroll-associated virus 10]|uniref:polyprotein n=1 Tax=Grapevine leafroll-associated virus 10 TaxID=367121 RepID=UPI000188483C|nr:polyprotein [Grapevine leafroll-associated virus 10]CAU89001.1 polyprotein [Grapevine leafroll-associated virus 10]